MTVWPPKEIHQGLLEAQLRNLFPRHNTINNARKEAAIKNPLTGVYLEVDVWLPEVNLCFEFQDEYHFMPTWYARLPLHLVQQQDNTKKSTLLGLSQTLIAVPYWWDGKESSLKGTIQFHRPDLIQSTPDATCSHIPDNPTVLPGRPLLMLAAFPETITVEGNSWWVGEKWDGIRCCWNTCDNQLYSRQNNAITLCMTSNSSLSSSSLSSSSSSSSSLLFGPLTLDGELWCGRGFYLEAQNTALNPWDQLNYAALRMVCFDEASIHAQHQAFETRYKLLLTHVPLDHPILIHAPRFICSDEGLLMTSLQSVTSGGGEGLIIRKPLSLYLPGKSDSIYKIKASQSDQEALVTKIEFDSSLLLRLPNGFSFHVPKRDCLLHQKVVKGDIVTFRFDFSRRMQFQVDSQPTKQETLDNYPTNPTVFRIRSDISWADVTASQTSLVRKFGNEPNQSFRTSMADPHTTMLRSYHQHLHNHSNSPSKTQKKWTTLTERRAYFDQFAASKGMDPLNPVFWYNVTPLEIARYRTGYRAIVEYNGGRLPVTLMQLYPDIGLRRSNFNELSLKSRRETERAYFDAYAAAKGKNPRNPSFWYTVSAQALIRENQEYRRIVVRYGGKLPTALIKLYPDIGLQLSRFNAPKSWKRFGDRRAYFDEFAASKGMDPLNPTFWYNIIALDIMNYKTGYYSISQYYGGTLFSTLNNIYPDIGLQKSAFKAADWKDAGTRKAFFDNFAAAKGGTPLNPEFWYGVTTQELLKHDQAYDTISGYYGGLVPTLLSLYPDIGLQKAGFKYQSWAQEADRRAFFDHFANSKGKDPLNPNFWYTVTQRDLGKYHGYWAVVNYYGNKISTALMSLYPNIGLTKSGFRGRHWQSPTARREYFKIFAASKGMDYRNPVFWHSIYRSDLAQYHPGFRQISRYYGGKLSSALMHLFPDIGLLQS